jgi:iron complex outermembrane receptor protein
MRLVAILALSAGLSGALLSGQTPASQPSPTLKENIVVTGTFDPLPLDEADRSVNAYQVPGRVLLFGSFADVLNLDSSVDLQQRAPGVQGDISIRGGTSGQTLVLLNGMRVNDAQSAHHNFDVPAPLDAISQVEVLRGSGSTLYGSDAVAGVVNVITRVDSETEVRFRSGVGNFGTNTQGGFLSLPWRALSQRVSFERELSTGFQDDREYRNLAGSYQAELKSSLGMTNVFLSGLDRPFGADQFYGNFNSWERTKTWFASLQQDLGENTNFALSYRRHTDLYVLLRDDPSFYTNRHEDTAWNAALRRHDRLAKLAILSYGVEGLADGVNSTNLGIHHRQRGAAYANLDIRALSRFSISAGAREEVYNSGQTVLAPSISGGYWLSSQVKIRGSASRAYRLPNFTDLYYSDPATLGNPFLKPEQATNYEGGVDFNPNPRLRLGVTVFRRNDRNDIDYVRGSPEDLWHAMNFTRLQFTGVELIAEARLARSQQISVQYTGLHGVKGEAANFESRYLFNYPSEEAVGSWQILTHSGILARTQVGVTNRYNQKAYALWDADVAWTRWRVRPYLQFSNLTNTSYQEIVNVAMPGRTLLGGVELCVICKSAAQ